MTSRPTSEWVVQQLREASPEAGLYRYVILDRDSKFDAAVIRFLKSTGLTPKRTSSQVPWQNELAERWIGSCRRELLDHLIALNANHVRRLIREYVRYHLKTGFTTPLRRTLQSIEQLKGRPDSSAIVISTARLEGLAAAFHACRACKHEPTQ